MEHQEFENWGKYNSLCPCMDCRRKFKHHMISRYVQSDNGIYKAAIIMEKSYFGKTFFNGIY